MNNSILKNKTRTVEINNFNFFHFVKFFIAVAIFSWIFYHIGYKYWSNINGFVLLMMIFLLVVVFLNRLKSLVIRENDIEINYKFRRKRDEVLPIDRIYLTLYQPPGASWSNEIVQIRQKQNDRVLYSFEINKESKENVNIYKLLINKGLKPQKLNL